MTQNGLTELKQISDGLAALGKPGHDDRAMARQRLALMERFERLVRSATPADRHEIAQTLRSMLADCKTER